MLCMTMMAAVLSASFAVFLVRERENNSKQVQVSTVLLSENELKSEYWRDKLSTSGSFSSQCSIVPLSSCSCTASVAYLNLPSSLVNCLQMISGASASAFWLATYVWDLLNFIIPAAGGQAHSICCMRSTAKC